MIDADERALMAETVQGALGDAVANGEDVDAVLEKLGWREMLRDEPDDAIAIVFGALGRTNAVSTALDDVLATALGLEPRSDLAVVLPPFGAWAAPGRAKNEKSERSEDDEVHAHGLATVRAGHARERAFEGVPRDRLAVDLCDCRVGQRRARCVLPQHAEARRDQSGQRAGEQPLRTCRFPFAFPHAPALCHRGAAMLPQ